MTVNGIVTNGSPAPKPQGMAAYRAPSLLQPHRARQALRDAHTGKIPPLSGFYCGVSSPPLAKVVAQMGYDMVWIDWEHSACNVETMNQMVHDISFVSEGKTIPLVRVPGHDHASIGYALDAGASIIVPQVDTVAQAKHIVSSAKFGRHNANGTRSVPPARLMPGLSDIPIDGSRSLWENLNDQAAVILQIESLEGMNNLDAILEAVGHDIDAVWLGTLDARVSMGYPYAIGAHTAMEEPDWVAAVDRYNATLKKYNMPSAGFGLGPPEVVAKEAAKKCFVVIAGDVFAVLGCMGGLMEAKKWPAVDVSAINRKGKNV